jgi:sugar lactone lactonase YvrE
MGRSISQTPTVITEMRPMGPFIGSCRSECIQCRYYGPNGIVLSANEGILYVSHNVSKTTSKIEQWPLNKDGSAGERTTLATVENCAADGMTVDKKGALWLTCYGFGTAYRVSTKGKILESVTTEQKALTNCRFGRRSDRHMLFLTSSDMERVTGYIYRAKVGVRTSVRIISPNTGEIP